jgi:CelD/BcsL family acetyltransferase involved in cellulose biosynthesis
MDYNIFESSLNGLNVLQSDSVSTLNWTSPFILPAWLQVWWQVFGAGERLFIREVKQGDRTIGIAPLLIKEGTAYFIGSTDVCDYQDFIVVPGREREFINVLLDDLPQNGIRSLDLKHVRPDAVVLTALAPLAKSRQYEVISEQEAVSYEMDLPSSFDEYLESLSAKQRHELRRKMRRLTEEGEIEYRFIERGKKLTTTLDDFLKMFVASRQDKAAFLTEQMKSYFRFLIDAMAGMGLLKIGVLALDAKPIAEVICFDYHDCIYFYNSGYDPQYVSLSAGLLSKVYAIKDSIAKGKKRFDFLKGAEPYKGHLGGKEVALYCCRINII